MGRLFIGARGVCLRLTLTLPAVLILASATFAGGAISYNPADPTVMIAGRAHGTVKSVDGGANWFNLVDLNGGPPAHAAMMEQEAVQRRGWLDSERFAEGLAVCQALPGPMSTQLAIWLGWICGVPAPAIDV